MNRNDVIAQLEQHRATLKQVEERLKDIHARTNVTMIVMDQMALTLHYFSKQLEGTM